MKSIKEKIITNQIKDCEALNNQNNNISVYIQTIQEKKEYYINITISKKIFKSEEVLTNNNVPLDIYFILHITPNFPLNRPRLFCVTPLRAINLNICDAKDILNLVLKSEKWNNKISAKDIILQIPDFLNDFYEKNRGIFFIGKYDLDYVYDHKILTKIPYTYLNEVEQIINEKTNLSEKRLLMITDLFFLIFSFERGVFSYYNNLKLIFWGSLFSIYGIKRNELNLEFEFNKNQNQRIKLTLKTNEGEKIKNILLYILKVRGVDYLIEENKKENKLINSEQNNQIKDKENNNKIDKNSDKNENIKKDSI